MILKEFKDEIISKLDSEEYYVMSTELGENKGRVDYIVSKKNNWSDFVDYWVQYGTGLSTEEFVEYNKLSKEEKEQITKIAKLNILRRQVELLEKEIK